MKKYYPILALAAVLALAGCKDNKEASQPTAETAAPEQEIATSQSEPISGTVLETINAASYTYLHLDTGTEKIWIAAPSVSASPGDQVVTSGGLPMVNFHSNTLDRTFETIFFVNSAVVGSEEAAQPAMATEMPEGHPPVNAGQQQSQSFDFSDLNKPEGGRTIAEIYQEKADLVGKEVTVRGIVVKSNAGILGKNWLHLQDGTGEAGVSNDLTVTTDENARLGDTVLVTGKVVADKDFGSGYKYDLILEEAKVAVE